MSSNFTVNRLCEESGKVFTAKTTVTRFCGRLCNRLHSRGKERAQKMAAMDEVVKKVLESDSGGDSASEYLNVKSAAKMLLASEKMVHHLILTGRLHAVNLSERKTLIRRSGIDKIFELPRVVELKPVQPPPIAECYSMGEAQDVFNISEKALFNIIKRHKLLKFKDGWYTYVAKSDLDKILKPAL